MSGARRREVRERRRAKLGLPPQTRPRRRCLGVITEDTTRGDLIEWGCTPEGADQILAFRKKLAEKTHRPGRAL